MVLWDAATGKRLADEPLAVKEGNVSGVAFSPDGKALAAGVCAVRAGTSAGGVVLWDAAGRKRLTDAPLAVNEGYVYQPAFSPDGKTLAAGYAKHRQQRRGSCCGTWRRAGRASPTHRSP